MNTMSHVSEEQDPPKHTLIVQEARVEIKRYEYRVEFVIYCRIDFISWRKRNIYVHKQVAGITRYATP